MSNCCAMRGWDQRHENSSKQEANLWGIVIAHTANVKLKLWLVVRLLNIIIIDPKTMIIMNAQERELNWMLHSSFLLCNGKKTENVNSVNLHFLSNYSQRQSRGTQIFDKFVCSTVQADTAICRKACNKRQLYLCSRAIRCMHVQSLNGARVKLIDVPRWNASMLISAHDFTTSAYALSENVKSVLNWRNIHGSLIVQTQWNWTESKLT